MAAPAAIVARAAAAAGELEAREARARVARRRGHAAVGAQGAACVRRRGDGGGVRARPAGRASRRADLRLEGPLRARGANDPWHSGRGRGRVEARVASALRGRRGRAGGCRRVGGARGAGPAAALRADADGVRLGSGRILGCGAGQAGLRAGLRLVGPWAAGGAAGQEGLPVEAPSGPLHAEAGGAGGALARELSERGSP